jgi:hypothetical protein
MFTSQNDNEMGFQTPAFTPQQKKGGKKMVLDFSSSFRMFQIDPGILLRSARNELENIFSHGIIRTDAKGLHITGIFLVVKISSLMNPSRHDPVLYNPRKRKDSFDNPP